MRDARLAGPVQKWFAQTLQCVDGFLKRRNRKHDRATGVLEFFRLREHVRRRQCRRALDDMISPLAELTFTRPSHSRVGDSDES